MFDPIKEGFTPVTRQKHLKEIDGRSYVTSKGRVLRVAVPRDVVGKITTEYKPRMRLAFDANGRIALYPSDEGVLPALSNKRLIFSCYMANFWHEASGIEQSPSGKTRYFMDVEDKDGEALIFTTTDEKECC